jgi:hypothetical protein
VQPPASNCPESARVSPEVTGSRIAVALSIAAHTVVGAIAATWFGASPPRGQAPAARTIDVEIYVEPVVPLAVTMRASEIDDAASPARRPAVRASRGVRVQHPAKIAAPPLEATPARREPTRRVVAVPSVQSIDHIAERAPSAAPPAPVTVPAHATFTMRIDRDGAAHLEDRPNLQLGIGTTAGEIEEERAVQWLEAHGERSSAVDMKLPAAGATIARFDVTDWAMRASGQDPYAHEKLAVLDATRDARAQIRARHREQLALQTPALVRASLDTIAALPSEQRSAALVELWRDCDDSTAGEIARATIVEYVRTHAVFSATDRAALSRR